MQQGQQTVWKYSYWLDDGHLAQLKQKMQERGVEMVCAQYSPCEVLKGEIGYAEPHVWPVLCSPDATPWYRESRFSGQNLVASSFALDDGFSGFLETTITPVAFEPPRMPDQHGREELSEDRTYLGREPAAWSDFPAEWAEEMVKGFARMTGNPAITFQDILIRWTAVHANFIKPRFRADKTFLSAPYSTDETRFISTCCVELFNLLDSSEQALLVRPCIGAVMADVALQDQYYLVVLHKNMSRM
jgi:hypothetical protein